MRISNCSSVHFYGYSLQAAIDSVRALSEQVGTAKRLGELGVTEADVPLLAKCAMTDRNCGTNPRTPTEEDMAALYRAMI